MNCILKVPVYKQKNALNWEFSDTKNNYRALMNYVGQLKETAELIENLAQQLGNYQSVQMVARSNAIEIEGPDSVLKPLVKANLLENAS